MEKAQVFLSISEWAVLAIRPTVQPEKGMFGPPEDPRMYQLIEESLSNANVAIKKYQQTGWNRIEY